LDFVFLNFVVVVVGCDASDDQKWKCEVVDDDDDDDGLAIKTILSGRNHLSESVIRSKVISLNFYAVSISFKKR
jgi:hypothetical protein